MGNCQELGHSAGAVNKTKQNKTNYLPQNVVSPREEAAGWGGGMGGREGAAGFGEAPDKLPRPRVVTPGVMGQMSGTKRCLSLSSSPPQL